MNKMFLKHVSSIVSLFFIVPIIGGCSGKKLDKLDSIKSSKKLVAYTNANFPPFEYMKGVEVIGADVDMLKEIASGLGVSLEVKDAEFDSILASIASGKADLSASAFTITDERKEQIDFSETYFKTVQNMIMKNDSKIKSIEDLHEKRVGVVLGYTGQYAIENEVKNGVLREKPPVVTILNSGIDGSLEVKNGKLDVLILDNFVADKLAQKNKSLKSVELTYENGKSVTEEEYAIAIPKGNPKLLSAVNESIQKVKKEGKFEKWVEEHDRGSNE